MSRSGRFWTKWLGRPALEGRPGEAAAGPGAGAARFDEAEFVRDVSSRCAAGEFRQAERAFLAGVAGLANSSVHPKEKMADLTFLPRLIQSGGVGKHGVTKLLRKSSGIVQMLAGRRCPDGGFIEFGCGAHDPLMLACFFYLNGFAPALGIDLLPARNPLFSALSLLDLLQNVALFPQRYCLAGTSPSDLLSRMRCFDLDALERGDLASAIGPIGSRLQHVVSDISDTPVAPGSCALLASFAVLEHVTEIDRVCRSIRDMVMPGGFVFHFVDLVDHRSYRPNSPFNSFSFLTEDAPPKNLNRLRAMEITDAHIRAGFDVVEDRRRSEAMSEDTTRRLLPRFRAMPPAEVGVVKQHLLLRRPLHS